MSRAGVDARRPNRVPVGGDDQRPMLGLKTRWLERAVGSNRILLYLAGITLGLSTAAGFLMHWIDKQAFPTVGTGIWWAVVTFCTVGYGDVVPQDSLGRFVAGIVMVFAITFITIITALVTSALVTRAQQTKGTDAYEVLTRIDQRLDSLEKRLP